MPDCPLASPNAPPLAYSLASFSTNAWNDPAAIVGRLTRAGIGVLTLVPTFKVTTQPMQTTYRADSGIRPLRRAMAITRDTTPSDGAIQALAVAAIRAGLHVRFEPHIDADVVFASSAGEVYWRARLLFDPMAALPSSASYKDVVIDPLMRIIVAIKDTPLAGRTECKPCFALTMGSEVEMSVGAYPDRWLALLRTAQQTRTAAQLGARLDFGHKYNHDHAAPGRMEGFLELANKHNQEVNAGPTNLAAAAQRQASIPYFSALDYLSFSFYPSLSTRGVPDEDWQKTPTKDRIEAIAAQMKAVFDGLIGNPFGPAGKPFQLGEVGIGSKRPREPWRDLPDDMDDEAGRNVRRHYVAALIKFVTDNRARFRDPNGCLGYVPFSFWSVQQYDWAAIDPRNAARFGDPALVEALKLYDEIMVDEEGSLPTLARVILERLSEELTSGGSGGAEQEGGGRPCFVATAAYGSPMAEELDVLRWYRDARLSRSRTGRALVRAYERAGPVLAAHIEGRPRRRAFARALLRPAVSIMRIAKTRAEDATAQE